MSLEYKGREQTTVADKSVFPIADYEMSVRDYVVRPAANGLSGAITITLPPVGKAIGKFYSIVCRNADAVNTVTVEDDNNDSECWNGDFVMNGKCDAFRGTLERRFAPLSFGPLPSSVLSTSS